MRILILGFGSIGRRHLTNLLALGETDVWVYDKNPERMEEAAKLGAKEHIWEIPEKMTTCVPLPLGSSNRFDAVLICTPPREHVMWAGFWLKYGAHVFIEKPLSDRLLEPMPYQEEDGIGILLKLAEKRQRVLMVGYQLRFHKGLLNARHHWDELGYIETITATYSQALDTWRPGTDYRQNYLMTLEGGIILEQSHEIDYCRWLAGEVEAVECKAENTGRFGMASYDVADIVMYHRSGTESRIHLDCLEEGYMRTCFVQGTEGLVNWGYDGGLEIITPDRQIVRVPNGIYDPARTYVDEMAHFLKCCKGEAKPVCDGKEGARVLQIALACVESAKENGRRIDV